MKNYKLKIKNYEIRRMLSFTITIFSFFIMIQTTNAQSVDSLVNEAIVNNPKLKSLQYRIEDM